MDFKMLTPRELISKRCNDYLDDPNQLQIDLLTIEKILAFYNKPSLVNIIASKEIKIVGQTNGEIVSSGSEYEIYLKKMSLFIFLSHEGQYIFTKDFTDIFYFKFKDSVFISKWKQLQENQTFQVNENIKCKRCTIESILDLPKYNDFTASKQRLCSINEFKTLVRVLNEEFQLMYSIDNTYKAILSRAFNLPYQDEIELKLNNAGNEINKWIHNIFIVQTIVLTFQALATIVQVLVAVYK